MWEGYSEAFGCAWPEIGGWPRLRGLASIHPSAMIPPRPEGQDREVGPPPYIHVCNHPGRTRLSLRDILPVVHRSRTVERFGPPEPTRPGSVATITLSGNPGVVHLGRTCRGLVDRDQDWTAHNRTHRSETQRPSQGQDVRSRATLVLQDPATSAQRGAVYAQLPLKGQSLRNTRRGSAAPCVRGWPGSALLRRVDLLSLYGCTRDVL